MRTRVINFLCEDLEAMGGCCCWWYIPSLFLCWVLFIYLTYRFGYYIGSEEFLCYQW